MDPFSLAIILILIIAICLQVWQIFDFSELRSLLIEALYLVIIISLIINTDFLEFK